MKAMLTTNLLKFTFAAVILAILFRLGLSASITYKTYIGVISIAALYAILMWFNGRYFGRKEYEHLPLYDIGFRFHLSTFLAHNIISLLWFVFGFQSNYEGIGSVYIVALIWAVFLIIHLIYFLSARKSSIKNLDKDDIFE